MIDRITEALDDMEMANEAIRVHKKKSIVGTFTKTELLAELERLESIERDPDKFSWQKLTEDLRYIRCQNCISYEDRKGCDSCTEEILYAYDNFYQC